MEGEEWQLDLDDTSSTDEDADYQVVQLSPSLHLYYNPAKVYIWPSAKLLAGWLLQDANVRLVKALRVLELGCGLALPSLAAAAQQAAVVYATDASPAALAALQETVQYNHNRRAREDVATHEAAAAPAAASRTSASSGALFGAVQAERLEWGEVMRSQEPPSFLQSPVDVILAADTVYEERFCEAQVETICLCLAEGGLLAVATRLGRNGLSTFLGLLARKGFRETHQEELCSDIGDVHTLQLFRRKKIDSLGT